MSVIKLSCTDQALAFTNLPIDATGGVGGDSVEFAFCSLWSGYEKTAHFFLEDWIYEEPIDSATNRCPIPFDVLAEPGKVRIGVSGVTDGAARRFSVCAEYTVVDGVVTAVEESAATDVYEEIMAAVHAGYAQLEHAHGVATSSKDGFMSAADKAKLNGLSAGTVTNAVTLTGAQTIAGVKTFEASNFFDGEQKFMFEQYCPTVTDIASGIGASMKNARAVDCQLYVAEVYAPYWAAGATHNGQEAVSGLTATVGQIDFYVITGAASGQPTGRKLIMQMKEDGLYVFGKKVVTE